MTTISEVWDAYTQARTEGNRLVLLFISAFAEEGGRIEEYNEDFEEIERYAFKTLDDALGILQGLLNPQADVWTVEELTEYGVWKTVHVPTRGELVFGYREPAEDCCKDFDGTYRIVHNGTPEPGIYVNGEPYVKASTVPACDNAPPFWDDVPDYVIEALAYASSHHFEMGNFDAVMVFLCPQRTGAYLWLIEHRDRYAAALSAMKQQYPLPSDKEN